MLRTCLRASAIRIAAVFALASTSGCGEILDAFLGRSGDLPTLERESLDPVYRVGTGDALKLTVFREPDLSGTFTVDGRGTVALPLIGRVRVAGHTVPEVERGIAEIFRAERLLDRPSIGVEVTNYRPFYILGQVNRPGSYPYVEGINVLNAVAVAGGFTYRAKESSMTLLRADPGSTAAPREYRVDATTTVLPGDIIRVPQRYF